MITNLEALYRQSNPPTELVLKATSLNQIPYWEGTCPNCGQQTLQIYDGATKAYCNACNSSWSMFSFCQDVLGLHYDDMVGFIIGKDNNINEFDYRKFAKIMHPAIWENSEENAVIFECPEGRVEPGCCPACGRSFFAYKKTGEHVFVVCLYCGKWLGSIRKTKNAGKKKARRGQWQEDWARKVRERYDGRCALCGSTDRCEAHHVLPYSVCEEFIDCVNNGILLCKKHHDMIHTNPVYIHNSK